MWTIPAAIFDVRLCRLSILPVEEVWIRSVWTRLTTLEAGAQEEGSFDVDRRDQGRYGGGTQQT